MNNEFGIYMNHLELMAFFSGYPLIYAVVRFMAQQYKQPSFFGKMIFKLLPFAYALTGTLFLGFVLKNMSPDFNLKYLTDQYLRIWGLLAVVFWIPFFHKKTSYSFLHSLLFFFLLVRDIFISITFFRANERDIVQNDMKIYTGSLLLNAVTLFAVVTLYYVVHRLRIKKNFR